MGDSVLLEDAKSTEPPMHEIDPRGDVILVLESTNEKILTWQEKLRAQFDSQGAQIIPRSSSPSEPPADGDVSEGKSKILAKYRVSSKHLALTCPYFQSMFDKRWSEGETLQSHGQVEVQTYDFDVEALLLLMKVLHCQTKDVPERVTTETITNIAVLVDFYGCHDAVTLVTNLWFKQFDWTGLNTLNPALIQSLCITWVFKKGSEFAHMTHIAQRKSTTRLQTYGLPIPPRLLGEELDQKSLLPCEGYSDIFF